MLTWMMICVGVGWGCCLVQAHTELGDAPPYFPINNDCQALQNAFAKSVGAFMECSGLNSSPITFCKSCVEKFEFMKQSYDLISTSTKKDEEGKRCYESLVNSDKINIIHHMHKLALDLWNSAYCDTCFASISSNVQNGTVNYTLQADVERFLGLNANASFCMHLANMTANSTQDVCDACRDDYRDTNALFEKLYLDLDRHVCMDVADAINRTRRAWFDTYHCHVVLRDDVPVFSLSLFVILFPLVFYVGNQINSTRNTRRIVRQKRMPRLLRSMTAPEMRNLLPSSTEGGRRRMVRNSSSPRALPTLAEESGESDADSRA